MNSTSYVPVSGWSGVVSIGGGSLGDNSPPELGWGGNHHPWGGGGGTVFFFFEWKKKQETQNFSIILAFRTEDFEKKLGESESNK